MQLSLLDQPGLRAWSPSHGHTGAAGELGKPTPGRSVTDQSAAGQHAHAAPASTPIVGAEPGARRIELGRGAWLELIPSWLPEQAALFELLAHAADWEQHRRTMYDRVVDVPRLVAGMPGEATSALGLGGGERSLVQRFRHRAPARQVRGAAAELRWLAVTLSHRYQRTLTDVSLAYYRDGHDSVAYHGDKLGAGRSDSVVAILSLGARRRFLLRPARQERSQESDMQGAFAVSGEERSVRALRGEETLCFELGEGDLLVMGGTCQETFEHAIPKAKLAGPRIAVMFRQAEHSLARRVPAPPSLRLVR